MNRRGCEQLEELLQLYASGQATADERRMVEEHLAECPACRETLKYIRRVDAFIAGQPELPACMAARLPRIDEGVEAGIGRRRFLPPWLAGRALDLAASLAMVVVAGLMALGLWLALSQVQPATDPIVVPAPPTPHSVPGDPSLGRIAFTREGDIWVKDLPDGQARRITQDGNNDTPLWSPSASTHGHRLPTVSPTSPPKGCLSSTPTAPTSASWRSRPVGLPGRQMASGWPSRRQSRWDSSLPQLRGSGG